MLAVDLLDLENWVVEMVVLLVVGIEMVRLFVEVAVYWGFVMVSLVVEILSLDSWVTGSRYQDSLVVEILLLGGLVGGLPHQDNLVVEILQMGGLVVYQHHWDNLVVEIQNLGSLVVEIQPQDSLVVIHVVGT